MGRDSNGLFQPPYLLHVQEMGICGQRSWWTHVVLIRNAPTDACDATCTSGIHSPVSGEHMCNKFTFSDDSTRVFVNLNNKHTDT